MKSRKHTFWIPDELWARFEAIARENFVKPSQLLRKAMLDLIKRENRK